ncbi:hypothetical protein ACHAWF_002956 [Thalassiosira exigua]
MAKYDSYTSLLLSPLISRSLSSLLSLSAPEQSDGHRAPTGHPRRQHQPCSAPSRCCVSQGAAIMPDPSTYHDMAEEWRIGHGRNMNICRSTSAIISLVSSTLLVIAISKSRDRLSTTYHRLILGMCVADLLASSSSVMFGAAVPGEMAYLSWNASGNVASCDAQGFVSILGSIGGVWYSCSLNVYYLVKIKYNRSDNHIRRRVEPWLHGLPTLVALSIASACLAGELINGAYSGTCAPLTHQPPHCHGVPDGEVVEGYTIPCGRGNNAKVLIYVVGIVGFLLPPIAIGMSLGMIYRNVLRQERRIGRYGASALNVSSTNRNSTDSTGDRRGNWTSAVSSLRASVKSRLSSRGRVGAANNSNQGSRAVMYRAIAYALAFFITWIWFIVYMFLDIAGAWVHTIDAFMNDVPIPAWQVPYDYCWQWFQQLQGFWTLVVFLQPKAYQIKNQSAVCSFRAFGISLWSGLTGKKYTPRREEAEKSPPPAKSSQTASSANIAATGGARARTSDRSQAQVAPFPGVEREGEKA